MSPTGHFSALCNAETVTGVVFPVLGVSFLLLRRAGANPSDPPRLIP